MRNPIFREQSLAIFGIFSLFLLVLGSVGVLAGPGGVQDHLNLTAVGGTYVYNDDDPWLTDSSVTTDLDFNLDITNNHPQKDVYRLYLVVAVNRSLLSGESVIVDGAELTNWTLVTDNKVQPSVPTDPVYNDFPNMGIYQENKGVYYDVIEITIPGDGYLYHKSGGSPGETISIPISINPSGPIKVHFDAVGADINNKAIVQNSRSSDVTHYSEVPEFTTIAIPVTMILGLVFFMQRRKKE